MFNYAKNRVPPDMKQEQDLHMKRMTMGREPAIQEDAKHLALLMRQQGKHDPEELMEHVRYWEYVMAFDRPYYDSVRRLAIELVPHIDKLVPLVPNKQPPGGGGAGGISPSAPPGGAPPGAPPSTAGSARNFKMASIYLIKEDGKPHKLLGSFASDIITGRQQCLDENGNPFAFRVQRDGDLSVSISSPAAIEANRIQDDLMDEIRRVILSFVSGKVANPKDVADAACSRIRRSKSFDLLPVTIALSGGAGLPMGDMLNVIRMVSKVKDAKEPALTDDLRKQIGSLMDPYMTRLKRAFVVDGIKFIEVSSPLPSYTRAFKPDESKYDDKKPPASPAKLLGAGEIDSSIDFRSLLLTAVHGKNDEAAQRLTFAMALYPESAKHSGICDEDLSGLMRLEHGRDAATMASVLKDQEAPDAAIMEAYTDGSDFLKACISHLVLAQKRQDIISAVPEMCMLDDRLINVCFFSRLDAGDPKAANIILTVADQGLPCPSKLLSRKLMELWPADHSGLMARYCKFEDSRPFGIALLAQSGDWATAKDIIEKHGLPDTDAGAIAAIVSMTQATLVRQQDQALPDLAVVGSGAMDRIGNIHVKPERISSLFGRSVALLFMKTTRVNWEGASIPLASRIFSCPDNPLPLARSLADIEDSAGMLVLLHKCSQGGSSDKKPIMEAMRLLVKKLTALGLAQDANAILAQSGISIDKEGEQDGNVFTLLRAGDMVGAAMAMTSLFETDPEAAISLMDKVPTPRNPKLFMEMLPIELVSKSSPAWAATSAHAVSLPYGRVAVGKSGLYEIDGVGVFAASCGDALAAGAIVLAQGLGVLGHESNGLRHKEVTTWKA